MPADFLDSNVVLYSLSADEAKYRRALDLLADGCVLSTQVLNETANVMLRKLGYDSRTIRAVVQRLVDECHIHQTTPATLLLGLELVERYRFSLYDSTIVATALESGCSRLYSEDLQHGQIIRNELTVINPFLVP